MKYGKLPGTGSRESGKRDLQVSAEKPYRVRDHRKLKTGHKTRLWCSQDEARKKKQHLSTNLNAKRRDNVGMQRFPCQSKLVVSSKASTILGMQIISVRMQHRRKHKPYYDVSMPPEALDFIRSNLEWSTPVSMVSKIQGLYPNVSAKQIHSAWTVMSETLWKRDDKQLPSAKLLLEEFGADVDVFELESFEGVEQLCWGMPGIATPLTRKGVVKEVAFDATCKFCTCMQVK
jgi:hypothetical protein